MLMQMNMGSTSSIAPQTLSTYFETGSFSGTWGLQHRVGLLANEHRRSSYLHLPVLGCTHTHHF